MKPQGSVGQDKLILEHPYLTLKARNMYSCGWLLWYTPDHGGVPGWPRGPWRTPFVDRSPALTCLLPSCSCAMRCLMRMLKRGRMPTGDINFVQETLVTHLIETHFSMLKFYNSFDVQLFYLNIYGVISWMTYLVTVNNMHKMFSVMAMQCW